MRTRPRYLQSPLPNLQEAEITTQSGANRHKTGLLKNHGLNGRGRSQAIYFLLTKQQ